VLGAFLLSHTVCEDCGLGFNGKSGRPNRSAVRLYLALLVVIAVAMVAMR
jgi:hypothetical protein